MVNPGLPFSQVTGKLVGADPVMAYLENPTQLDLCPHPNWPELSTDARAVVGIIGYPISHSQLNSLQVHPKETKKNGT